MQLSSFLRKTLAPLLASFSLQAAADELPQVYSRNSEKILRGGAPFPLSYNWASTVECFRTKLQFLAKALMMGAR